MVHIKHRKRTPAKIAVRGEPRFRSRSLRRVQRRTPGGRTVVHYEKPLPKRAHCAICKDDLHGLKRARPTVIKRLPRVKKTVQRPFGANLCSGCAREIIKWRTRVKYNLARADEIPISYRELIPGAK